MNDVQLSVLTANCCYRKAGVNLPTKKLVPAHVVPSTAAVTDTATVPDDKKVTPSSTTSADSVASAAVAAVIASQTYMKVSASVYLYVSHHLDMNLPECVETLSTLCNVYCMII